MCGEGRPGIEATVLFAVECRRPLDDERVHVVSLLFILQRVSRRVRS